jgi:hypothetical protein
VDEGAQEWRFIHKYRFHWGHQTETEAHMVQWNQGCSLLCVEIARTGVRPEQHPIQFDMPAICEHRAVRTMGPTELTLTNAYSFI